MRKNIVLISLHFYHSKRRAGFHHIADALNGLGHNVTFVTTPISWIHRLKGDYRFGVMKGYRKNRLLKKKREVNVLINYSPFHLFSSRNRIIDQVLKPLGWFFPYLMCKDFRRVIKVSDYIIFESTPALLYFDRIKKINGSASLIYRVSDDLRNLGLHQDVIRYETKILPEFNKVSVPSKHFLELFGTSKANVILNYHGINKGLFDKDCLNPYQTNRNAVFIGVTGLDYEWLEVVANEFADWNFIIIGGIAKQVNHDNIIWIGEIPFAETIAYLKFADIGLHTIKFKIGAESLTDSLKALQYAYLRKPVVAPLFLKNSRDNMSYYDPFDQDTYVFSFQNAIQLIEKDFVRIPDLMTYEELAQQLISNA